MTTMGPEPLGLARPFSRPLTEDELRTQQVRAIRARRLLDNEDFRWWTDEVIQPYTNKLHVKIAWTEMDDRDIHIHRGIIRGVQRVLRDLNTMASKLTAIDDKLEQLYGKRPVERDNRGA